MIREHWYDYAGVCSYCAIVSRSKFDNHVLAFDHKDMGLSSLRLRISDELRYAETLIPEKFTRSYYMRKTHLARINLSSNCSSLIGTKSCLRPNLTNPVATHVVMGVMHRTWVRLSAEPDLHEHAEAYSDFLKLLLFF